MYMLLNMTTGRMYMLFNFSGVEIATGCIGVYFFMLILPLDAFIEIATGRISFIISGTALILPLGVCDETATGRVGLYF